VKLLRIAVGVLVAAYGLFCLYPILTNALFKLGALHPAGEALRLTPLWDATPWWQLALWTAIVSLYGATAVRLVRGQPALGFYVVALFLDAARWWLMQSSTAYQQVFTPAELEFDYVLLLGTALAGVTIWWIEKRPPTEPLSA